MKKFFKTSSRPIVNISRCIYLAVCVFAGVALSIGAGNENSLISWTNGASIGVFIGCVIISLESWLKGYSLSTFTHATFGLLAGLMCWLLLTLALKTALFDKTIQELFPEQGGIISNAFHLFTMTSFGFLGTVLALRSHKDDFAFIIPYVRFKEDSVMGQPMVIDMSTLIDGRLTKLIQSGFIKGRVIIPRVILEELKIMNNSPSGSNRARGERGLHNLEYLQKQVSNNVSISEASSALKTDSMDSVILQIAKSHHARIITLDDSLAKIADLRNIPYLNIDALDKSLRPTIGMGTKLEIFLAKPGKDSHQGVGQLEEGHLVVVNNAAQYIGTKQRVIVTSTINMANGLMAFAELESNFTRRS